MSYTNNIVASIRGLDGGFGFRRGRGDYLSPKESVGLHGLPSLSLSRIVVSAAIIGQVAFRVNFPSPDFGLVSARILHLPSFISGRILV
jgi:hypothetical protein